MTDINLLEDQLHADSSLRYKQLLARSESALAIGLVLSLVLGGGFMLWAKQANKKQARATQAIEQKRVDLENATKLKRDEVVATQARVQTLSKLLPQHAHWTNALSALNAAVIPGIQFSGLASSSANALSLNGTARDYPTLADFTQKLKEVKYVEQVVLNASSLSEISGRSYYRFTISVTFQPEAFNFQEQ